MERQVLVGELQAEGVAGGVGRCQTAGTLKGVNVGLTENEVFGLSGQVFVERGQQAFLPSIVSDVARE